MQKLEKAIGYSFRHPELLREALSHSSYANETLKNALKCYERLEFLGDSILGFVTADYLYRSFPETREGELSKIRAELVCETALARCARKLGLGEYLLLGRGEEQLGGREKNSILADVVEAVLAAIYLDGGFTPASAFVRNIVLADAVVTIRDNRDYKSLLQERVQRTPGHQLSYELLEESGPDHDKRFTVRVLLDGEPMGTGTGTSKKRAEQAAARAACGEE